MMSEGMRSEVNWMRLNSQFTARERAYARVVLPTPGTSSMRMCPPAMRQVMTESMAWGLPWIWVARELRMASIRGSGMGCKLKLGIRN